MFTETELREMLEANADRLAAAIEMRRPPRPAARKTLADETGTLLARKPDRVRIVAPLAIAACTAAVIAGAVALTARPHSRHNSQTAASQSQSQHSVASTSRDMRSAQPPGPTFTGPITDVVHIDTRHSTENLVEPVNGAQGQQDISSQVGHERTANLIIAPANAFNDSKITRTHPVAIAGTTGYYAVIRLFPLSAGGNGGSAPAGAIIFRTPDRHWGFASLQAGTHNNTLQGTPVNDPSAIVGGFNSLHAEFESGTYRVPLRLGYLPVGTSFVEANQTSADAKLVLASITAEGSGNKQLDVSLLSPGFIAHMVGGRNDNDTQCPRFDSPRPVHEPCTVTRVRNLSGGFQLVVQGTSYSAAETQKVLNQVTVAANPSSNSHYFPLRQAIG